MVEEMSDERKKAILDEILELDGIPLREPDDFTIDEYRQRHLEKYGYPVPETTAWNRLDARVEKGELGSKIRYDAEENKARRVWWKKDKE